jgi:hypothetical protein
MSLSILLASTSLYLLHASPVSALLASTSSKASAPVHHDLRLSTLFLSAWIGSFYMLAALTAALYPGTAWTDPEFRQVEAVDDTPQLYAFSSGLLMLWLGWGVERRRLMQGKGKVA